MTLIRKNVSKGDIISNFRPITLLNIELSIWAKVLEKRLECVVEQLVGEVQTCTILSRSINDNFHLLYYFLERVRKISGKSGTLVPLNQSKAFYRVDHWYLTVVLEGAGLGPNFRVWVAALYNDIVFIVRVNDFFSK